MHACHGAAGRVYVSNRWAPVMVLLLSACGDLDGNIYLPLNVDALSDTDAVTSDPGGDSSGRLDTSDENIPADSENPTSSSDDAETCHAVPWGASCKKGNQIYDLKFSGVEAATKRAVSTSLEDLHCLGYNSAVIVAGDTQCTVCPGWYREVGARIDDIHNENAVVIAISTANFGADDLSDLEALEGTKMMQPDYATGSNPFTYPCRYDFTPFTMVVNLRTATILDSDSAAHKVTVDTILNLVQQANQ